MMEKGPGFSKLLWDFVDGKPKVNRFRTMRQVPAETAISRAMSKELAQRGFKFCGPTIVYAFMQAVGMVNDHLITCHRHEAVQKLRIVTVHCQRRGAQRSCLARLNVQCSLLTPFGYAADQSGHPLAARRRAMLKKIAANKVKRADDGVMHRRIGVDVGRRARCRLHQSGAEQRADERAAAAGDAGARPAPRR